MCRSDECFELINRFKIIIQFYCSDFYDLRIEVKRFSDRSLEVKDYGRGIPMDWNENEKQYNYKLLYCELYSGGKLHLALTGKTSFTMNYVWNDANKYNDENNGNRRPKYRT